MSNENRKRGKYQSDKGVVFSKYLLYAGLSVVCFLLVTLLIYLMFFLNRDPAEENQIQNIPEQSSSAVVDSTTSESTEVGIEATEIADTTETSETEETEETKDENNKPKETKPKDSDKETKPKETEPKETTPSPTEPQIPVMPSETSPQKTVLSLPYTIPGTNLVVQRVAAYNGIYMEDGSNQESSGVAMMLLKNTGSEAVEYAEVIMQYDDKTLTFKASALPAGSQAVVQAEGRATCASGDLTVCSANVATLSALGMAENKVSVVDNGDNTLTVKNLTDSEIVTVRVFYKYYMKEESTFVGGITYTAKISNLASGASVTISPSHFTSDSGKVVMVRTYDVDA